MPQQHSPGSPPAPSQIVGVAVQNLAAARLGKAFVPLALLCAVGAAGMWWGGGGWLLPVGAPVSAAAMLVYAQRVVQHAFARPPRLWMTLAWAGGIIPLSYGIYVLGWLGLREVARGGGLWMALFLSVLGVWLLRAWMQLVELQRLAETMAMGLSLTDQGDG